MLKYLLLAVNLLFLSILLSVGQPVNRGPGGGNGKNPCQGANPPPSCNNVPIDSDIIYLIIAGSIVGIYFIRLKKTSNTTSSL